MAVRPAYGFPIRRQAPVSAGLSSSFAAILENRKLQEEAGTQVSTKDIKISNDAKKASASVAPSAVVSTPAANIGVTVPAPAPIAVVPTEAPSK